MPLAAEIVDAGALLSVIVASFAAGTGLTVGFSVLIASATRAAELRREGNLAAAVALMAAAVLAGLACAALIAFGIYIMASK